MDAILYIKEMLSSPVLRDFLSENVPHDKDYLDFIGKEYLIKFQVFMKSRKFKVLPGDKRQALIESVRLTTHEVGNFMSEIVGRKAGSSKQSSSSGSQDLVNDWNEIKHLIKCMMEDSFRHIEGGLVDLRFNNTKILEMILNMENIENRVLEVTYSSIFRILPVWKSRLLFFKKAFPDFLSIPNFKFKLNYELGNLPWLICNACKGQPHLALLLIGGLLSLKPIAYDTWNRVKDDLVNIKESSSDLMRHILTYCYNDLPYFLQLCFLYFACYPIDYEIPATSLIKIWIAEGFVSEVDDYEETANKYLEELVQRSLVFVSKKSLSGTIRICRVPPIIHEFAIKQSQIDGFLVANPDQEEIESLFRLAIHQDNKKQYTEVTNNHIRSFLAFNFDSNVLGRAVLLRVLELRKSAIPVTTLPNMISLRYLGLRGSNISKLPENIGDMENLQTLDVRDTSIETLPESLWNIPTLCNVYVEPSPKNKGPPSAANISDLHILKTVEAPESWAENIPHFLIHLRKLALSNWDNLEWKYISNLLSQMDKLISMAIMGKFIPAEFVDTRAFPNFETVKSIKLEGQWICRKLFIDYVKFPPNLTKLTLTNSGLKEDPMPPLERLQALKFLSLQDGAYIGNQMVCSEKGFPQLQFLELKKLENLENWEVQPGAMFSLTTLHVNQCGKLKNWDVQWSMSKLTTLRVVQCQELKNLPDLEHVTDKVIDN